MRRIEFRPEDVEKLLVLCHRRCCVCHRFCGVRMEVDHLDPAAEGGSGEAGNAIPLCFECHAEVHHYNPKHPKGRRFTAAELRRHRDQGLDICCNHPEIFVHSQPPLEAGAVERLAAEVGFNARMARFLRAAGGRARFEIGQFRRAVADGTVVWLAEHLREAIASEQVGSGLAITHSPLRRA